MVVDQEKLKKLQAQAAAAKGQSVFAPSSVAMRKALVLTVALHTTASNPAGGKGAPRRKAVKVGSSTSAADDKKLSSELWSSY